MYKYNSLGRHRYLESGAYTYVDTHGYLCMYIYHVASMYPSARVCFCIVVGCGYAMLARRCAAVVQRAEACVCIDSHIYVYIRTYVRICIYV